MDIVNVNAHGAAQQNNANAAFDTVIALIDEMIAVVDDENRDLARGIPAALTSSIARKNELADQFEVWVALVKERHLRMPADDEALRGRLLQRTANLRERMAENVNRLQAAMEASRRRVEAVMNAIRQQAMAEAPYGANGRVYAPRTLHAGVSRRI